MGKTLVEFYFDVVSPWSYIGFETLARFEKIWNLDIVWKPVLLGGVMQGSGNQPPATLPAKAAYGMQDLIRSSEYYGIHISSPTVFPTNTITCQRVLVAMQLGGLDNRVPDVARCLWKAYWGGGELDIGSKEGIMEALNNSTLTSTQIEKLLVATQSLEVKEQLKLLTKEVLELGAFGAPWIVVTPSNTKKKEVFFGSDRFHLIAQLLGKTYSGPFPSKL